MTTQTKTAKGLTRRKLLKGTAVGVAATTLGAPTIWAQNIKDVTLRQFGTGVSNLNDVANKVKEDLGFHAGDDGAGFRFCDPARGNPAKKL